jgi:hypothetical protein
VIDWGGCGRRKLQAQKVKLWLTISRVIVTGLVLIGSAEAPLDPGCGLIEPADSSWICM